MLNKKKPTLPEETDDTAAEAAPDMVPPVAQGVKEIQSGLKQLSPTSDDGIQINRIPTHCAKLLGMALNLEWFGHTGRSADGAEKPENIIAVRVASLNISLAEFFTRMKGILNRIENK